MLLKRLFPAFLVFSAFTKVGAEPSVAESASTVEPAWPHEISDLEPDPSVIWGQLDSGIRYAIMQHDEPPGRLSLRLLVRAGSLMEEDDQQGLAHFLEHMAFNGTEHFAANEMVEYFQRLGMAFGADTNAHTSFHETVYKLELPNTSESLLDDSFNLLRDYAEGMLLLEEEIESERGIILAEKRARESVDYRIARDEMHFSMPQSLIPKRFPIGEEDVIQQAQRERFQAFYERWYSPERMVLVVVGDIDPDTLLPYIEKYFGALKPAVEPAPDPDLGEIIPRGIEARVYRESEASAVAVSISSLNPFGKFPDTAQRRAQGLVEQLANSIINRRLSILSKDEEAVFTSGSAYSYDWMHHVEVAGIELRTQPQNWEATLQVAERELRRALSHGFTESELTEAKARFRNKYEEAVRQAPSRKSRGISNSIVSAISNESVFTSPEQDLELALQVLDAATPRDALNALKRVWGKHTRLIYVSGNLPAEVTDDVALAAFTRSIGTEVEPPEEREIQEFAYTEFGEPATIVERTFIEDLEITQLKLSNNVFVNLKPTQFEKNVIRVMARFGSGELTAPRDKPGLPMIASLIFTSGGLEAHSADDLERIFSGKTVGTGFSIGSDAFALAGVTNGQDLENQLQLLAAYMTAPGYRPEALNRTRRMLPQFYNQLAHTPEGVMRDPVARFLAGDDYRFGVPPMEDVMQRTLEEMKQWLDAPLKEERLELSIVGDFDPEEVLPLVQKTFGALPERSVKKPEYEAARNLSFPRGVEPHTFNYTTIIPKGVAMVTWPTEDTWDIGRTRRLSVLADILGDRLRVKVREELGEAYSPNAYNMSSDTYTDYGYLAAMITVDPEAVERITQLTRELGAELAASGTNADELERILNPTLEQIKEWRRNNRYWLNNVLAASQEHPVRLDWARSMQEDIASIKVEELNTLAQAYLKPDEAVEIRVIPETQVDPATFETPAEDASPE